MKKDDKQYDIFISYRRSGGIHLAKLIQEKLIEKGYRVFMDVENLKSGKFNEQLYSIIEKCKDVLLICSPGAWDRFSDPDDWVRLEISHAIKSGKNIVPIIEKGFSFPPCDSLPEELRDIVYYHALTPEMELFYESINSLCNKYLTAKPVKKIKTVLSLCVGSVIVVCLLFFFLYGVPDKLPPNLKTVDQLCTLSIGVMENSGSAVIRAVDYCRRFVDGDIDEKDLREYCLKQQEAVDAAFSVLETSNNLITAAEGNKFCDNLLKTVNECNVFKNYIDFTEAFVKEPYISSSQKKEGLVQINKIVECLYLISLDEAYGAILPIMSNSKYYDSSETVSYIFSISIPSELSVYLNDSLFGQGSSGVTEQTITKITDGLQRTISQSELKLESISGKLWMNHCT